MDFTAPTSRATFQDCLTWPRICGSPTTMESSDEATRKRWRMASRSRNSYRWGWTVSEGTAKYSCRKRSRPGVAEGWPGSCQVTNSTRLQVERMRASRMPG